MIFAKLLLSILSIVVSFASYLHLLRVILPIKLSPGVNIIVLSVAVVLLLLFIIVSVYIHRIRRYNISRLDSREVESISRLISFIPFFFVIVSVLSVFGVSAYEYRVSKNWAKFLSIVVFALPLGVLSYYFVKIPLYELRFLGFFSFRRSKFVSIFYSFVFLVFLHAIACAGFIWVSMEHPKHYQVLLAYVLASSFIVSITLFVWNLVLRMRYVVNVLKAPESKFVPVFSNDEVGLISVYVSTFVESKVETSEFPEVYIGDTKVRIELGKQFCGCVWIKLFDAQKMFSELSEKVIDEVQTTYSKVESKVIETKGFVAKFDGTEMFVIWGLDGTDWVESLRSFIYSISALYRENVLESINVFKVGIAGGRVFVGRVDSINGNLPYFFGEAMIESYVVGKYPKGDGIFVSGELKDVFGRSEFVDRVKVKELDKIVEIHRLLI